MMKTWAGLHNNVPADLLPKWQKVRQSRATQPRSTDVPDWGTSLCRGTHLSGIVTVLILSAMVASWHPTGATLAEGGSVWDVAVQPNPWAVAKIHQGLGTLHLTHVHNIL